jgi:hyperosmotically inducible periplasmic protein
MRADRARPVFMRWMGSPHYGGAALESTSCFDKEIPMNSMRNVAKLALCTTLALGAVGVASTAAFADEMPAKSDQPVTDTWITTKVKTELATTDGVKSTDISVTTKDGVVALIGVLGSDAAVEKAVAATKSVKGVKKVDSSGLKVK